MKQEYYDYIVNEIKLKPLNEDLNANQKQQIECLLCGNIFEAIVKGKVNNYRKHGMKGCKDCTSINRYSDNRKEHLNEVKKKFDIISNCTIKNLVVGKKLQVRNKKCKHIFWARWENLKNETSICPICNTERKRQHFQDINEKRHKESYLLKDGFDAYKQKVYKLTRENYRKYKKLINPDNLERVLSGGEGYHLDHIISVRNSFDLGVPEEVCADYRNLRMVKWKDNNNKWKRSSLKIPEPYHPYIKTESDDFIQQVEDNIGFSFEKYVDFQKFMLTLYNEDKKFGIYFAPLETNAQQILGSKNYFKQMKDFFEEQKIKVVILFEDEWLNNRPLIIDKIKHYAGINDKERIHARQCSIEEISFEDKNAFLNKNHIQGTCVSQLNLGAFWNNELVAVLTFSKPRVLMNKKEKEEGVYELARFATDANYRIPGIASKLLKFFECNYEWREIYSYADRRWSEGNLYDILGFDKEIVNPPNYHYIIDGKRKHRWGYRKDSLKEKCSDKFDKSLTEYQNMLNMGYDRIWDSGSIKYTKKQYE